MKSVGKVFSDSGDVVKGTGMTLGDLRESGMGDESLGALVGQQGTDASTGLKAARIGTRIGMGAMRGAMNQQQPQQGGAMMPDVQKRPLDPKYWELFTQSPNTNAFYGK